MGLLIGIRIKNTRPSMLPRIVGDKTNQIPTGKVIVSVYVWVNEKLQNCNVPFYFRRYLGLTVCCIWAIITIIWIRSDEKRCQRNIDFKSVQQHDLVLFDAKDKSERQEKKKHRDRDNVKMKMQTKQRNNHSASMAHTFRMFLWWSWCGMHETVYGGNCQIAKATVTEKILWENHRSSAWREQRSKKSNWLTIPITEHT